MIVEWKDKDGKLWAVEKDTVEDAEQLKQEIEDWSDMTGDCEVRVVWQ